MARKPNSCPRKFGHKPGRDGALIPDHLCPAGLVGITHRSPPIPLLFHLGLELPVALAITRNPLRLGMQ